MALTKVTGQVINNSTGLVVGVTTVGGGLSATDGFFSGIVTAVGDASFSGNVSVGGTLTYEDVTNIDAVGIITARSDVLVGSGITLSPDGDIFFTGIMTGNGSGLTNLATDLVNDTSPQLGGNLDSNSNHILLNDSARLKCGTGGDLQIYHEGSASYINNAATGDASELHIRGGGNNIKIQAKNGEDGIVFKPDGAVELYHDDTKKLETASGGVTVSGTVAATSFTGSGAALTGISAGITMSDQWRITSDNNKTNNEIIDSNWERNDTYFAQLGSGMTESSGVFTFPSTGIYLILAQLQMNGSASYAGIKMKASADSGSNYDTISYGLQNPDGYSHLTMHAILDVTNASNFRLRLNAVNDSSTQYSGSSSYHRTGLTFIRLGDT